MLSMYSRAQRYSKASGPLMMSNVTGFLFNFLFKLADFQLAALFELTDFLFKLTDFIGENFTKSFEFRVLYLFNVHYEVRVLYLST